ncbi:MAG: phosphoribosyl 1,2-cyclic phosphodiesterase [Gammaproteobacteria bacterium]|jgi:phosphoribosyl 1,2-cyclic phosphodiesterase
MSNAYLRFWGVRGSYSAPFDTHLGVGGNTSCVEIRMDDHVILCDAGTGIIPFGNEIIKQSDVKELMIILTHYHWDHICGLPFFVPAFIPDWKINFFGPGESAADIKECVSAQMRAPFFPVGTETWLANINYLVPPAEGNTLNYGPISFSYQSVHHPGTTYGYRININGKTVLYISDNECLFLNKAIRDKYAELNREEQQLYDAMQQEEYNSELDLIKDADILIHDAQYTPADYSKKHGWGHSCYIDTVNTAIDAGVKELYLYHHDPNYDDNAMAKIEENANAIIADRSSELKCFVAKEGMIVEI